MEFERPMNIQLFADEQGAGTTETPNTETTQATSNTQQTTNTVSKELYDRTASEVAELKRQLKEIQKNGKSEAELKEIDLKEKDAELQKRNEELHKLYIELNRANAKSILAETQAKFNLKDPKLFDNVVEAIVVDNGDVTKARATALNDLLKAVYEKGVSDVKTNQWADMSKGLKSSGEAGSNEAKQRTDFIKSIVGEQKDTSSIKDQFKL